MLSKVRCAACQKRMPPATKHVCSQKDQCRGKYCEPCGEVIDKLRESYRDVWLRSIRLDLAAREEHIDHRID